MRSAGGGQKLSEVNAYIDVVEVQLLQSCLLVAIAHSSFTCENNVLCAVITQPFCKSHAKPTQASSNNVAPVRPACPALAL